jgi:hypothetical protein
MFVTGEFQKALQFFKIRAELVKEDYFSRQKKYLQLSLASSFHILWRGRQQQHQKLSPNHHCNVHKKWKHQGLIKTRLSTFTIGTNAVT